LPAFSFWTSFLKRLRRKTISAIGHRMARSLLVSAPTKFDDVPDRRGFGFDLAALAITEARSAF